MMEVVYYEGKLYLGVYRQTFEFGGAGDGKDVKDVPGYNTDKFERISDFTSVWRNENGEEYVEFSDYVGRVPGRRIVYNRTRKEVVYFSVVFSNYTIVPFWSIVYPAINSINLVENARNMSEIRNLVNRASEFFFENLADNIQRAAWKARVETNSFPPVAVYVTEAGVFRGAGNHAMRFDGEKWVRDDTFHPIYRALDGWSVRSVDGGLLVPVNGMITFIKNNTIREIMVPLNSDYYSMVIASENIQGMSEKLRERVKETMKYMEDPEFWAPL